MFVVTDYGGENYWTGRYYVRADAPPDALRFLAFATRKAAEKEVRRLRRKGNAYLLVVEYPTSQPGRIEVLNPN